MRRMINSSLRLLLNCGEVVETEHWQGGTEHPKFLEVLNISPRVQMLTEGEGLENLASQPWAAIHFDERVSGLPLNPPPSHEMWNIKTDDYLKDGKFSHSYPERMWPKGLMSGIRFEIGDLNTLCEVLANDPTTRQAVMPMYSYEDLSAALQSERVPCSLSWHFILRGGKLHCTYAMRSCDALRHFHNDVYFATKLTNWVIKNSGIKAVPGQLTMNITSFHCFESDRPLITKILQDV